MRASPKPEATCAFLVALASCGPAGGTRVVSAGDASADLSPASGCTVTAVDSLLRWNGRDVYVDPQQLLPTPTGYVVAADHTYLWHDSSGVWVPTADSVVGFFVDGAETLRPIPRPPDAGRLGEVRLADAGPGRWAWLFEELRPGEDPHEPLRIRSATLEDGRWSALDTVLDDDSLDFYHGSSRLVQDDGGLVWLMRVETGLLTSASAIWRRDARGWTTELFHSFQPERLLLADASREGIWAAGIGRPYAEAPYRSLVLFEGGSRGAPLVLFEGVGDDIFYWPGLVPSSRGSTLGWIVGSADGSTRAWAVERVRAGHIPEPVLLQADAQQIIPLVLGDGRSIWLVHHFPGDGGRQELRVYAVDPTGEPVVLAAYEHPFLGYFGAVALGDATVVVVGPDVSQDPTRPLVRSLQKRLSLSCD